MNAENVVRIRAFLSLTLLALFAVVLFTGIGLYFAPPGRVARRASWNFLGFSRQQLENLHTFSGFAMSALALAHLAINSRMLLNEVRISFRKLR